LAEKSGLGGCDTEDRREGGRGSSSSVSSEVEYFSSSLSESITILVFVSETSDEPEKSHVPLMKTALQLLGGTANSQLKQVAGFAKQIGKMSFTT
jgi:hypothetical protein